MQETFDKLAAAMRNFQYPLTIPPRPSNPRTLEIDDLERVARFKKLYGWPAAPFPSSGTPSLPKPI